MSMWNKCGALALVFALTACANDGAPAAVAAPEFAASKTAASQPSIVQVALQVNGPGSPFEGQFDALITALTSPGQEAVLAELSAPGQRTVFAPTDDAFAALGLDPSNIGALPADFVTQVLLTHVVNGRRDAADVISSTQLRTLQGSFVNPSASATLTDPIGRTANIIVTDVFAKNGIIHAIDAVLLPFAP